MRSEQGFQQWNLCLLLFKTASNLEEAAQFSCLGLCGINSFPSSSVNMEFVVMKQYILISKVHGEKHHEICARLGFGSMFIDTYSNGSDFLLLRYYLSW